ncbi:MAG: right-handed parallel beta-helix repeat-containing protein [Proteobacteria bacterium]|nr:right-handed parallel beta-helix repeat-containing protein [Pseudomonadota bacterium]MBU1689086.1 right-handed parallel beta-helix repeat-containing protein [Pseudomonadota bacterium]
MEMIQLKYNILRILGEVMRGFKLFILLFLAVISFIIVNCGGGGGGSTTNIETSITENWTHDADSGQGAGRWMLTKNGQTTTGSGEWNYSYNGYDISCPFTNAPVTISGSSISFTATGTATAVGAPAGYGTSSFNLAVTGLAVNGEGNGDFNISFTTNGWPSGLVGKWSSTRTSGSGITVDDAGSDVTTSESTIENTTTTTAQPEGNANSGSNESYDINDFNGYIYVNYTSTTSGNGFTPQSPMLSLNAAVARATEIARSNAPGSNNGTIFIFEGRHNLSDKESLPHNWSLLGVSREKVFISGAGIVLFGGEVSDITFNNCNQTAINGYGSINRCAFNYCSSAEGFDGGALQINGSSQITNCSFNNCTALGGGAITVGYISASETVVIADCIFESCSTFEGIGWGGAIYGGSGLSITNCTFDNCEAYGGGAIYLSSPSRGKISSCTFIDCSASYDGGGIHISDGKDINIEDCTFNNCKADGSGGGVSCNGINNIIENCSFFEALRYFKWVT